MFTGLFTGTRGIRRALAASEQANFDLGKLKLQVQQLEEELAALKVQHLALRGRFYATRNSPEASTEPQDRESRRAAAFKSAGWSPGQPVQREK